MSSDVSAVLFDLDGTLCEYERQPADDLHRAFEAANVDPFFKVDDYYDRFGEFVEEADGVADLRMRCFRAIAVDRGRDPELGSRVAAAYTAIRDPKRVQPISGARNAVKTLSEEYLVGLITNGPPSYQQPKLDSLGFAEDFGTIVFAGFDTAAKPNPEPFKHALADLRVGPAQAIHVGNSINSDVQGARAAGLGSVWLTDGKSDPQPAPDYSIDSLSELLDRPWES